MPGVLDPHGVIASEELTLMVHATELMLIVVVPVFALLFFFAYYYRASNTKATYTPNWEHAKMDELIWWAIPFEIVLILGALTWSSTHALDPKKPLDSARGEPPLTVQVVALEESWLFIYPELAVSSEDDLYLPVDRPIEFQITSDAPMNSFWIPALGGQIYAMTGMVTTLHLMADTPGLYEGGSANYSGPGFTKMHFPVVVSNAKEFDDWVKKVQSNSPPFNPNLFQTMVNKYLYK